MTSSLPAGSLAKLARWSLRWWSPRRWGRAVRRTGGRDFLTLAAVLAVLGAAVVVVRTSGLRYQRTGSLPRGLYRIDRAAPLVRGAIGTWCLPEAWGKWARARRYLARGGCPGQAEPIGKVVLAMAGDTVDLGPQGLRLNGRVLPRTAPVLRDGRGRPLESAPFGRYVLSVGQVWLWSPYAQRSFDSRYFGPITASALISVVRPVWTVEPPAPAGALLTARPRQDES